VNIVKMFGLADLSPVSSEEVSILLLVGLAIFLGVLAAKVFNKIRIPHVVGYIVVGIVLGPVFGIFSEEVVSDLEPVNVLALGVIGFLIGGELKKEIFAKFGNQVITILIFEGMAAFFLVFALSFSVATYFLGWKVGLAVGAVLGAICAATDPASTMGVLWESKSRGPLSSMLTAIVALDDALALVLYAVCIGIVGVVLGGGESFVSAFSSSFLEVFLSLVLGVIAGFCLNQILKKVRKSEKVLAFLVIAVLFIIGIAVTRELDVIMSCMAFGVTLTNIGGKKAHSCFELMKKFSGPIYILFFVLVGTRLKISSTSIIVFSLVFVYLVGSIAGKTLGSYIGATYCKTVPAIRKYLGFCLYQQGTIAIALLLMATTRFEGDLRDILLSVIISGVLVLQLIGPIFSRIGLKLAGETGLNITEEDLINSYYVRDVMVKNIPSIASSFSIQEIIDIFIKTEGDYYPVVQGTKMFGAITLEGIKNTFRHQELSSFLIAMDLAEPVLHKTKDNVSLSQVLFELQKSGIENIPVFDSEDEEKFVGVLNLNSVNRKLSAEVMAKQHEADSKFHF